MSQTKKKRQPKLALPDHPATKKAKHVIQPNLPLDLLKYVVSFLHATDLLDLVRTSTFWHHVLTKKSHTPISLYGFRKCPDSGVLILQRYYNRFCSLFKGVKVKGISLKCHSALLSEMICLPLECIKVELYPYPMEYIKIGEKPPSISVQKLVVDVFRDDNETPLVVPECIPNVRNLTVIGSMRLACLLLEATRNLESFTFNLYQPETKKSFKPLMQSLEAHSKSIKHLVFTHCSNQLEKKDDALKWDSRITFDNLESFQSHFSMIPPPPTKHIIANMILRSTTPRITYASHIKQLVLDRVDMSELQNMNLICDTLVFIHHDFDKAIKFSLKEVFIILSTLRVITVKTICTATRSFVGNIYHDKEKGIFRIDGIIPSYLLNCFGPDLVESKSNLPNALKWNICCGNMLVNNQEAGLKSQKEIESIQTIQRIRLFNQTFWIPEIWKLVQERRDRGEEPIEVYFNNRKQNI